MANRWMYQFYYSFIKNLVALFAQVTIGASGAPTLVAAKSKGIASIVRNSAGDYTITLQDKYNDLIQAGYNLQLASGLSSVAQMIVQSQDVAVAKTIIVQFLDYAGAVVDPDSGSVLRVEFKLRNTGVL